MGCKRTHTEGGPGGAFHKVGSGFMKRESLHELKEGHKEAGVIPPKGSLNRQRTAPRPRKSKGKGD